MSCHADKAVIGNRYPSPGEDGSIKLPDVLGLVRQEGAAGDLVKVTVDEPSVGSHTEQVSAHDPLKRLRVEAGFNFIHIAGAFAGADEKVSKSPDRHIGEHVELIEADVKAPAQFPVHLFLKGLLGGNRRLTWPKRDTTFTR
jgi:hypothetical protein